MLEAFWRLTYVSISRAHLITTEGTKPKRRSPGLLSSWAMHPSTATTSSDPLDAIGQDQIAMDWTQSMQSRSLEVTQAPWTRFLTMYQGDNSDEARQVAYCNRHSSAQRRTGAFVSC